MSDRITIINDAYVIQSSISFHSISKFILKRKNSLLFFLPYAIMGKKKWAAASTARSSCCVSLAGLFLPFQQGFYFYLCFFNVLASVQDFKNHFQEGFQFKTVHVFHVFLLSDTCRLIQLCSGLSLAVIL
nr:MAG TPA: hypothetical protein [Caudoviricetes sp.]